MNAKKYITYLIYLNILIYLFVAICVYFFINNYHSNRMFNLHKIPQEYRTSLMYKYIDKVYKDNSILFLGDSQPYGFLMRENKIFTSLLQEVLHKNVLNFSFSDSRILDAISMLSYLQDNNMSFDRIVYNVDQWHVHESDFKQIDIKQNNDYRIGILKNLRSFFNFALLSNPPLEIRNNIILKKYEHYFDMNVSSTKLYTQKLIVLIRLSKNISKDVIVYITPHSKNAIIYNNPSDIDVLARFSKIILNICKKENIKCFKPNISKDKYFIDITHFNTLGHKEMTKQMTKLFQDDK